MFHTKGKKSTSQQKLINCVMSLYLNLPQGVCILIHGHILSCLCIKKLVSLIKLKWWLQFFFTVTLCEMLNVIQKERETDTESESATVNASAINVFRLKRRPVVYLFWHLSNSHLYGHVYMCVFIRGLSGHF